MSGSVENTVGLPSFFDGVPAEATAGILGRLETRRFPAGSVVVAEGDSPRQMYLAQSGTAEVMVGERRVGSVQPGTTVGEMSLFTGQPASATVRAIDEFVVYALSERELERIASAHPQIYRNLAAILSNRLARTNRLAARKESGTLVVLQGGPPIVAYALRLQHRVALRMPAERRCWSPVRRRSSRRSPPRKACPGTGATVRFDRGGSDGSPQARCSRTASPELMPMSSCSHRAWLRSRSPVRKQPSCLPGSSWRPPTQKRSRRVCSRRRPLPGARLGGSRAGSPGSRSASRSAEAACVATPTSAFCAVSPGSGSSST